MSAYHESLDFKLVNGFNIAKITKINTRVKYVLRLGIEIGKRWEYLLLYKFVDYFISDREHFNGFKIIQLF